AKVDFWDMPENLPFLLPLLGRGSSARHTSLSKSVTSRPDFAELLLQIETHRREHPLFVKTHEDVHELLPLRWFAWWFRHLTR
ncbi:MAG: hypothetical protein MR723_00325, partial [Collinsella sp.]|nr:hypothetical protein [Collinsella sp.]